MSFPQVECTNPKNFSKAHIDIIVFAYNYGAPKGMGYIMAAIAWQESCAGAYMMNFQDPSAGLYHAHIPIVLKYYSNYKDTDFNRNVMGQKLINNRNFASEIALETLLYWHKYHKGDLKKTIKSYNKGFKWEKDKANNSLAESYYTNISQKITRLESYIPRYSKLKNQSTFQSISSNEKIQDANKQVEQAFKSLNASKQANPSDKSPKPKATKPSPNNTSKPSTQSPKPKDFIDLPSNNTSKPQNFDENFEDFHLIFEG